MVLIADAIAHAGLRHDEIAQPSLAVSRGELPAQLADVNVDIAVLTLVRLPSHGPQEAAFGHQTTGIGEQHAQDLEFAWDKVDADS